ncbi:MAG: glycosyltransferase family 2 protein [Candidatus Amulumruptor caecigallinarius]|nr:glycosyltransferase family 2 protein [Candidatus Amulumruptor caecigallinarius]MCM1397237.1 glycosyltransferase family 2 protein [Candidatus Amulumruptor caecigallinarius]MCM1453089.1 glycosyltransferase family 2 protein [bacterium]
MEKIYFVMPAYNEEANIESVVRQWHGAAAQLQKEGVEARLVIANDGSKDSTYARLKELEKKYPLLRALDKPNSGHGATLLYLYRYALENGADYVFQTDSDGQTDPEEFAPFWAARHEWDFQIGHRSGRQDGFSRVVVTKVLKGVVRVTFGVSVTDANTPFRLMKAEALKEVMQLVPDDFFLSNVAISALAVKRGFRCRWLPITFKPRQGGVNSINLPRIFKIGRKAVGDFIKINRSAGRSGR